MASTKDYADFILEQLSGLDEITARKMMGEYILYYREKVIGGIYDNRFWSNPLHRHKRKCRMPRCLCPTKVPRRCFLSTMWIIAISLKNWFWLCMMNCLKQK